MCRSIKKCFQKFIKILIRIFQCIFCCRCRKKIQPKQSEKSKIKTKYPDPYALTSIKVDEHIVKQLLSDNHRVNTSWSWPELDFSSETQSVTTANTENFEMMESFSKDVNINQFNRNRNYRPDPIAAQVIQNSRKAMTGRRENLLNKSLNSTEFNSRVGENSTLDDPINLGYEHVKDVSVSFSFIKFK